MLMMMIDSIQRAARSVTKKFNCHDFSICELYTNTHVNRRRSHTQIHLTEHMKKIIFFVCMDLILFFYFSVAAAGAADAFVRNTRNTLVNCQHFNFWCHQLIVCKTINNFEQTNLLLFVIVLFCFFLIRI